MTGLMTTSVSKLSSRNPNEIKDLDHLMTGMTEMTAFFLVVSHAREHVSIEDTCRCIHGHIDR